MTLRIYPCLAAGYFILFLMYAEIIFLYYFNDMKGCVLTGLAFCLITMTGSMISSHFTEIWYGAGLVAGSFAGWTVAYRRLQWMEKHLDVHIFCNGHLLKKKKVIVRHQKCLTDMNSKRGTKEKNGSGRYTEVICDRIRSVYGCEGNSVTCKEKDDRTILSCMGVFCLH